MSPMKGKILSTLHERFSGQQQQGAAPQPEMTQRRRRAGIANKALGGRV